MCFEDGTCEQWRKLKVIGINQLQENRSVHHPVLSNRSKEVPPLHSRFPEPPPHPSSVKFHSCSFSSAATPEGGSTWGAALMTTELCLDGGLSGADNLVTLASDTVNKNNSSVQNSGLGFPPWFLFLFQFWCQFSTSIFYFNPSFRQDDKHPTPRKTFRQFRFQFRYSTPTIDSDLNISISITFNLEFDPVFDWKMTCGI